MMNHVISSGEFNRSELPLPPVTLACPLKALRFKSQSQPPQHAKSVKLHSNSKETRHRGVFFMRTWL